MNTNYTKGKWVIDGEHIVSMVSSDNSNNETICDINPETEYPTVGKRNIKESLSNARLISAAPDLLEACILLKKLIHGEPTKEKLDAYRLAEKAIEKALGE